MPISPITGTAGQHAGPATSPASRLPGGAGTPLELLGSAPGVTIIDPATVLTRLWYFDGKFLRAEGFRLDQEYVRSLVALSNQAVGTGVVHSFDVRLDGSDALGVEGGLALAPSGRVVYLPSATRLPIAQLVARAQGALDPGEAHESGHAYFGRCVPDEPADSAEPVPPRALYVLTVAAADALCGEEERFGRLCEDACATETDRSVAVEGVRFRLRELVLSLPTSRTIPFSGRHLRSRIASAYYAAEREAVRSQISGAGLRSSVWCAGADGIGGEEVPLAVLDRNGAVTRFVDMWTVRRELMETTPQRYWQSRAAMRPLDVFWAQVLQFQCQLADLPADGGDGSGGDACADERRALATVDDVLGTLTAAAPESAGIDVTTVRPLSAAVLTRLGELRNLVTAALVGDVFSASGSLLVDRGVMETPSAGYLPVNPARDVREQVRAWMGPGVDLRFCVVRPDFVPEAFQEAQHMDRISLTRGIDDPAAVEEVDVLVPGGTIEQQETRTGAFLGEVEVLPSVLDADTGATRGAALTMAAVARDQVTEGWSWSLAAYGEAPQRLGVFDLARAMFGVGADAGPDAQPVEVHVEPATAHRATLADPGFVLRATREASAARLRRARIDDALLRGAPPAVADLAVRPEERRPIAAWVDIDTAQPLEDLPRDGRTALRARATVYSRGSQTPVLIDARVEAVATVTSRQELASGATGGSTVLITTRLAGFADPLVIAGGQVDDGPPRPLQDVELKWRVTVSAAGVRTVTVEVSSSAGMSTNQQGAVIGAKFSDGGEPRHVTGTVAARQAARGLSMAEGWRPLTEATSAGATARRLLDLSLDEAPGALDVGQRGHDLASSVIDVIGAELTAHQREDGFVQQARARMFGAERADATTIKATADWVMFHRRRTITCTDAARPQTAVLQRLRWYHAVRPTGDDVVARLSTVGGFGNVDDDGASAARVFSRLDDLGFRPVTTVEFLEGSIDLSSGVAALRTAFSAADRGERVVAGLVTTSGPGEGAALELGRLGSVTGAVADLIDVTRVQTRALEEIPPEFQTDRLHGVLLTLGMERPVDRGCAHVFRLTKAQFARLLPILRQLSTQEEVLAAAEHLGVTPPVVVTFTGDVADNLDDLLADWKGQQAVRAAFVLDQAVPTDSEAADSWRTNRVDAIRGVLGFEAVSTPGDISLDLSPCGAALFVEEAQG